jgi:peptide/nickel transport system substrate-binding protein
MRGKWALCGCLALLGLVLTGCGGAANTSHDGSPARGGTLRMLGAGDVDFMDPNVSYYTVGYLNLRMWDRQLLSYPAVQGQTTNAVPDLATQIPTTSNGGITQDGTVYKLTIRTGVMWDTSPPRPVVAADVVRGVERTCNPVQPFGGLPDFENLIKGMESFCTAFAQVAGTVSAIKAFIESHSIPGLSVDPTNPQTVVFTLVRPATYFVDQLAMPVFSPAPLEYLDYLPASDQLAQHTISDGPYLVQSYVPGQTIVYGRNPVWNASSDLVRQAYVDKIVVSETGSQEAIQQRLQANTPSADMGWDTQVPSSAIPGLLSAKNPNLVLGPSYGNPYLVFNEVSPNDGGAMADLRVRQALEYGINRTDLIQDDGGPRVSPPLTHVLPPGIVGSRDFDPYAYNPQKARELLGGRHLTLKLLYVNNLDDQVKMFETLRADLGQIGISVQGTGVPNAEFFTKYMEVPAEAHRGVWDMAFAAWYPDWYGNGAPSFFNPLFSGAPSYPPGGSNFGFYDSAATNQLIRQAEAAPTVSAAGSLWARADAQVMADAPVYEITSPTSPIYHASQVHNAIFVPVLNQFDPTNVWLNRGGKGGG